MTNESKQRERTDKARHSAATTYVTRNLQKAATDAPKGWLDSEEALTSFGRDWLRKHSVLADTTIDGADYGVVLTRLRSATKWESPVPTTETATRNAERKPVIHERTGELVGWLTKKHFYPI